MINTNEQQETNQEAEHNERVQALEDEINKLRDIKNKKGYTELLRKNFHVLLLYTNKDNEVAGINKTLRKAVDEVICRLIRNNNKNLDCKDKIYVLLDTNGGRGDEAVEIYDILDNAFDEPSVIIADAAWSAGTIFSLCCNSILMLENSLLGAIDTQIYANRLGLLPAFSYIEGVNNYIDYLLSKVVDAHKEQSRRESMIKQGAIENNLASLTSSLIDIQTYGHCSIALEHIANAVAFRHRRHKTTHNDLSIVKLGVWRNFIQTGKMFGHGHGLNLQFLQDLQIAEYDPQTDSWCEKPMFLNGYICPIHYQDEILYDQILEIHEKVLRVFAYLDHNELPNQGLVAHLGNCKII